MKRVFVSGAFDDVGSLQIRFLQEAAKLGPVTILLWPDAAISSILGRAPRMGLAERKYYFEALRFADSVEAAPEGLNPDRLPGLSGAAGGLWALSPQIGSAEEGPNRAKLSWAEARGLSLAEIPGSQLAGFPYEAPPIDAPRTPRATAASAGRVVVTGCYDWLHSGHLRFFEEASAFGELNVVIGSDANVRLLKGEGHPLFSQAERRYVVGAFRPVARCLVSTGSGWMDADPEIKALGINRYVVNEDGDKPEKRLYCEKAGIEYIVLRRVPKEGLPRRSSTDLRGF
jgi:cytidyltransferase-like protein